MTKQSSSMVENRTVFGSLQSDQSVFFNPANNSFYSPTGSGVSATSQGSIPDIMRLREQGGGVLSTGSEVWKVTGAPEKTIPVSPEQPAEKINVPALVETNVPINRSFNPPQTNTAVTMNTSSDLDRAVLNSFIHDKPSALDWERMISSATREAQNQALQDEKIREISFSPASLVGSMLSFHDPFGLRTLYYGGEIAFSKITGNKNLEGSAVSNIVSIREGYVRDVSSKQPLQAGLEKGAEAGVLAGSVFLVPALPKPIPNIVTLGYEGVAISRAVNEPTGENIFFATLPVALWGISKGVQGIKSKMLESRIEKEYYSDYGSVYQINKNGVASEMKEIKLLGGRLDKPLPNENYDVAVLLSEKKPLEIYGGGVTSYLSNQKFRIDRLGMMNPLQDSLGEMNLVFPKGYKGDIFSIGTGRSGEMMSKIFNNKNFGFEIEYPDVRTQLFNGEFVSKSRVATSSPSEIRMNLDMGKVDKMFKSITDKTPIAEELRSGSAEDMFGKFFDQKMKNFMSSGSESMQLIKLYVEPSKESVLSLLERSGKEMKPFPVEELDLFADLKKSSLFELMGIKDLSSRRSLAGIDLAGGKLITLQTETAENLVMFKPRTFVKEVPFVEEVIRYPYSNFEVGSVPNFMSSLKNTQVNDSVSSLVLRSDTRMKIKPELVEALKQNEEISLRWNQKLHENLLPRSSEATRTELAQMTLPKLDLALRTNLASRFRDIQEASPLMKPLNERSGTGRSEESSGSERRSRTAERLFGSGKRSKESRVITPSATWENVMITEMLFGGKALQPKITKRTTREFKEEFFEQPAGLIAGRFSTQSGRKESRQISEKIARVLGLRK